MKNILTFIFTAIALTLTAVDYNTSFNTSLTKGKLQTADSILTVWSAESPDDPELFPARFNMLLNRARSEMMVLSTEPAQKGEELVLADSTGRSAGYLRNETEWLDSLVDKAFDEIDRGIAAYPDRIDFYLGKAAAASITERWNITIETIDRLLDREKENGGHWLESGNKSVANADTILADAVFERIGEIYNTESRELIESALPLIDKAAQRFNHDIKIINIAGAIYYGLGNTKEAMKYFTEAMKITPDDAIPLTNIAYIHYQDGDTAKALEIYREIENGNYDEDSRKFASDMIAEITRPVEDMEKYFYFFRYLPHIAGNMEKPDDFMDIELVNSRIPSYNKIRSPFADADIKAEEITVEGKEKKVVVWTFPMPDEIPMCRFVAFVADDNGTCRVFTLEKSFENYWVVGTQDGDGHSNFGEIPLPDDAKAFVKALGKKKLLE